MVGNMNVQMLFFSIFKHLHKKVNLFLCLPKQQATGCG
jgi:hypothetical protein